MLSHILSRIAGNCQSKETPQAAACGVRLSMFFRQRKEKEIPPERSVDSGNNIKKICIKNALIDYGDSIMQPWDFAQFLIGKLE
jgi:hypothetical protein